MNELIFELVNRLARLETELGRLATIEGAPLFNLAATTAPGTGDDSDDGYQIGSLWLNTTGNDMYICCDATAAAAVWKQITP